jgi:hypothetical protein
MTMGPSMTPSPTTGPSTPSPTAQIQKISLEVQRQCKTGNILKWTAVGATAALGVAALAVVILLKATVMRKSLAVAGLLMLIGIAWAVWALQITVLMKSRIRKVIKEELAKAGIVVTDALVDSAMKEAEESEEFKERMKKCGGF